MSYLWILLLASLAIGTRGQGFDLSDALGDDDDVPTKRPPKIPKDPKKSGGGDLDLSDAFGPDPKEDTPSKPKPKPSGDGDDGFDLSDALKPGDPSEPKKPAFDRPKGGGTGGGSFGDDDLLDLVGGGGGGEYKPDPGKGGGGKRPGKYPNEPYDYDGGRGYGDGQKDIELFWTQILKLLSAYMPENFQIWISNFRWILLPLVEKLMEIINVFL